MSTSQRMIVVAVVLTAWLSAWPELSAAASDAPKKGGPSHVAPISGTNLMRVTVTKKAAERLDIKTAPVVADATGIAVPYAALLYDVKGKTWVYTNPEPLNYVRHPVEVTSIKGDRALLKQGPPAGTMVVVVGASELYGTELGVGH